MSETREIPLTHGCVALVDAADYEWLSQWKWSTLATPAGRKYAHRFGLDGGKKGAIVMHRLILQPPPGKQVDHINGDGLDNRRANLRAATGNQNQWNTRKQCNNTSGYKGVSYCKQTGRWAAKMRTGGHNYHLGRFDTPEEAARAYDAKALELHGEFARPNFPQTAKEDSDV